MATLPFLPFLLLFLVGLLLSTIFGITNIVLAFQESALWGILALLVPFAALVFSIKFWSRKWVRRSFLGNIGGAVLMIAGMIGLSVAMPGLMNQFEGAMTMPMEDRPFANGEPGELGDLPPGTLPEGVLPENGDAFAAGVNYATAAAELTQTAKTPEEWEKVATQWEYAVAMMAAVPADHPKSALAQTKVGEYKKNLAYAQQNSQ